LHNTHIKSYEFSILKMMIKMTNIYTLHHRRTTGADKSDSITYYWLVPA